jgi:hypothetical protein
MLLPLFDWRLLHDAVVHTSQIGAAVESLAVIVHNTLKSSQERRRRKNLEIYAEAREFVMQQLPDPVRTEIQHSSSGELSATSWQKHLVPVITALMPGFFIGTVRAQWGIEKVLSCFPNHGPALCDCLMFLFGRDLR